jgi:hypothetical protein
MSQLKGTGLDLQIDNELLDKLSKEHQLPIADGISDLGRSAFHGEHLKHELGAFLTAINDGLVSTGSILVVYSLDRLSRLQLGYSKQIYLDLTNSGVHIYSTLDNHLYKAHDIGSEVLSSVIFERAYNESKTKSARTTGNAKKLINDFNNGVRSPTGEPVAIKSVGSLPWFIDGSNGTINKHPYYWDAAQLVAKRIIAGVAIPSIKKELDVLYPPTQPPFKRDKWLTGTLRGFHKLEALQGNRTINLQGTKHLLEGYYPKLLSDKDYAQLIAARGKRDTYPVRKEINLITGIGIAKCSCGSAVANRRRDDHRATLFCLSGTRKENDCDGWYMSLAYAERAIIAIGKDVFINMANDSIDTSEIELLKLTLKSKQDMLKTLNQRALENRLPTTMLDSMLTIEDEVTGIQDEIRIKELELLKVDETLSSQWGALYSDVPPVTDSDAREKLKALIKKSVNNITFDKLAKSHFNLTFEFVNGHTRQVELNKGVMDWGNFSHKADVDMTYLTKDSDISRKVGLEVIANLPIEKD